MTNRASWTAARPAPSSLPGRPDPASSAAGVAGLA